METHNKDGSLRKNTLISKQLKDLGLYYNRPASEFIFLTKTEHTKLHMMIPDRKESISERFKGKPKSKIQKQKMAEYEWFNNGVKDIRSKECPKGFIPGRINFSREFRENRSDICKRSHWYNNGNIEKFCEICPEGFVPSRLNATNQGSLGFHWYNNGKIQVLSKICPPGFVLGKLSSIKEKQSNNIRGLKFFNNGVVNIRSKNCPEGFVPGRLNKVK